MAHNPSKFVWYDVMTTDVEGATAFYEKVVGWQTKDSGMPDRTYILVSMGETMVGGIMPIPEDAAAMGAKPMWMGYVGVDDVDGYAVQVEQAGGKVTRPPSDIPGIGRFAVVTDPGGAMFIIFKGTSDQEVSPDISMEPGRIGWNELQAADGEAAFAFYSGVFGWTETGSMDMGPMGVYRMFGTGGKAAAGGMMTKMPETPAPSWTYYFNVETLDAAAARVTDAGGTVLMGPQEVPGPLWIVQCLDPQGALFALVAPVRS